MNPYRHFDFQRIHDEFVRYYKAPLLGESEYYDWLKALALDEGKPYGQAKERFQWARDMIKAIGEDKENKYYKVLVAFPLESMNGNVYREADLREDAKRITQGHPSLNHKDEFWLSPDNPDNRWGTVDITGAEWEDGAVEALLKVPKTTLCPVCSEANKPLYQMIDEKHIVNVSLEGYNSADGHFMFDQHIPFTLLTSNVLPGIPLARIKPLEKIMVEALQVSTGKPQITKIPLKIVEDDNSTVNTKTGTTDFKPGFGTPVDADAKIDTQNDLAKTVAGNPAFSDNTKLNSGGAYAGSTVNSISKEAADTEPTQCPPGTQFNADTGKCEPCQKAESAEPKGVPATTQGPSNDTKMPKEDDGFAGPGKNKAPEFSFPNAGAFPSPNAAGEFGGNQKTKVVAGTAPLEHLANVEAQVAKINAQLNAKNTESRAVTDIEAAELRAKTWEAHYSQVYTAYQQIMGENAALKTQTQQAEERKENAIRDMHNAMIDKEKEMRLRNDAAGERDEIRRNYESVKRDYDNINAKYQNALQTNLGLSQKLTVANEEYLELARQKESLEEALGRARNEAKKITKITI